MVLESSSSNSRYPFVSWFWALGGPTAHSCGHSFTDTCNPSDSSNSSNTYCQVLISPLSGNWLSPNPTFRKSRFFRELSCDTGKRTARLPHKSSETFYDSDISHDCAFQHFQRVLVRLAVMRSNRLLYAIELGD